MTIRDKEKWSSSAWDWSVLKPCFEGTRISVGDVDGMVECNGHILIIEAKGEGVPIPRGQEIMHSTFADRLGQTVIVVWGPTNDTKQMLVRRGGEKHFRKAASNVDLVRAVRWWFGCAKSGAFNWPRIRNTVLRVVGGGK